MMDYSVIRTNLLHCTGGFAALNLVSLNRQDPDVTGNLRNFTRDNPKMTGLITEDAWRLVRHLNAIGAHAVLPFSRCRRLYDPESQILFSGDLFGGLNSPGIRIRPSRSLRRSTASF